ncbi:energy transducer TonB [Hymenobacter convexus]|uniref:energy transducer TonB n=1 Tax=Hymenobacter sp. CA1UV-4 TaxID=3063782 RepID=UPI002712E5E4|nr:energy transducer TonB [Hymenobacter sp. CA1UV-4]MDO7850356.1 energy transducer TonB [Hymenobacter sp. CA1UV-4]
MLLQLPTFNAVLSPCSVDRAALVAHPAGHFCGQCQRVVQDFSQSTDPVAALAAARATSPDGRVCGSFRRQQVAPVPTLSRRLRWFVVALVLVVGQGLSARDALAQVRRGIDYTQEIAKNRSERLAAVKRDSAESAQHLNQVYGAVIEKMPSFRGGGNREVVKFIQQQVVWPRQDGKIVQAQGRVFASFTVDASGRVCHPKIVKSLQPFFDAEVLRVLRIMPNFKPGRQNGKPVAVDMVVPVTFKMK